MWSIAIPVHGRIETRTAALSTDIGWLQEDHRWPGQRPSARWSAFAKPQQKTTTETAYYLLSGALSPDRHDEVVRSHWAVENQPHGRLDVVLNEDPTEPAWATVRTISPSYDTWLSM